MNKHRYYVLKREREYDVEWNLFPMFDTVEFQKELFHQERGTAENRNRILLEYLPNFRGPLRPRNQWIFQGNFIRNGNGPLMFQFYPNGTPQRNLRLVSFRVLHPALVLANNPNNFACISWTKNRYTGFDLQQFQNNVFNPQEGQSLFFQSGNATGHSMASQRHLSLIFPRNIAMDYGFLSLSLCGVMVLGIFIYYLSKNKHHFVFKFLQMTSVHADGKNNQKKGNSFSPFFFHESFEWLERCRTKWLTKREAFVFRFLQFFSVFLFGFFVMAAWRSQAKAFPFLDDGSASTVSFFKSLNR
jgi:hypothetical protein